MNFDSSPVKTEGKLPLGTSGLYDEYPLEYLNYSGVKKVYILFWYLSFKLRV